MESLRQKLFGATTSFADKLHEFIAGSYETKKLNDTQSVVTDTPNIIDRIAGKQKQEYVVKKDQPVPTMEKPFVQDYNQNIQPDTPAIATPRPETGFNKLRAGIEHLMGQTYQSQPAMVAQSQPTATAPTLPKQEPVPKEDIHARFRKGILYNENRGAIQAGKDPYQSVGPTGDIGKYQASPSTIAAWSKAWLGKKYTPDEFKKDPQAQEKFFEQFTKVKEKYKISDEDAAIMWHRGWGVLGYKGTFEEKKKQLKKYLDSVRNEDLSQSYVQSFKQGADT